MYRSQSQHRQTGQVAAGVRYDDWTMRVTVGLGGHYHCKHSYSQIDTHNQLCQADAKRQIGYEQQELREAAPAHAFLSQLKVLSWTPNGDSTLAKTSYFDEFDSKEY